MKKTVGRIMHKSNNLRDELVCGDELRRVTKGWCIIAPFEWDSSYNIYIFNNKKKESVAIIDAWFCLF